jgi:hypothetical protein
MSSDYSDSDEESIPEEFEYYDDVFFPHTLN